VRRENCWKNSDGQNVTQCTCLLESLTPFAHNFEGASGMRPCSPSSKGVHGKLSPDCVVACSLAAKISVEFACRRHPNVFVALTPGPHSGTADAKASQLPSLWESGSIAVVPAEPDSKI